MISSTSQNNASLLIIEFGMAAITLATSCAWPGIVDGVFRRLERLFTRLSCHRRVAVLVVGLSAFSLRLALLPLFPVPLPFCADDFSFLLAAETFAHGRLTNPTPAMWMHFETIQETMRPTYQSMYFPGQGLVLATGQVLFGHPWFALLIVVAIMCGAFTWMLQGWLPARWALLGGFIAVLRLGLFSLWINSYHTAGALTALGGALVLGALPRLKRTARLRYGFLAGLGVAILELTRPYDGVLLCAPIAVALGFWIMKGANRPRAWALARGAAVCLLVVVGAGAWLGYYDHAAFGSAKTLPYTIDHATYGAPPYYIWQKPTPAPVYRHEYLRAYYEHSPDRVFYEHIHSVRGFLPSTAEKFFFSFLFYTGFTLLVPLGMGWRALGDRRIRFLVLCLPVMLAGTLIEIYLLPQYLAAFAPAFYAIGIQAMRHLRVWRPEGRPVGLALVRLTVVSCVGLVALRCFAAPLHLTAPESATSSWMFSWVGPGHFGEERARVEHQLEGLPGGQLAIVRYGANHLAFDQWVYNSAEVDRSKVIWAGEMDVADDQKLLSYYHDRTAWLIEPDAVPTRITPYVAPSNIASR